MEFLQTEKPYGIIKQEWFDQWYNKSESFSSLKVSKVALATFELFVKEKYPEATPEGIISELKKIWNDPQKFSQLYMFLNSYVQYMTISKKNPKTIRIYFMFVKSFLRQFGIRITNEDTKQFINFPKQAKELRQPMTRDIIEKLLVCAAPKMKSVMLIAISSGARMAEILRSKVMDFTEITVDNRKIIQFRLRADNTKTREERYSFISLQAWESIQDLIKDKKPDDYIFIKEWNASTVIMTEQYFKGIRKRAGFLQKYGNGFNYHVNFHSLRSFFLTKATQKAGENTAHAWIGHHKYLDQYFRLPIEEKAQLYFLVEPEVTIELKKLELKVK